MKRGFTLIEVMVTTAVLSLGTVLIYNAFFISLDSFNYCSNYLTVSPWISEKIWQAQESINLQGLDAQIPQKGKFTAANKDFNWNLSCMPMVGMPKLFKIKLEVFWKQGSRNIKLSRMAYALHKKE